MAENEEQERMVTVAILDSARVFQGSQDIPADQVTDQHLVLPNGCDLEPGKYRHDEEKGSFVFAGDTPPPEENPENLRNIALGFIALHDHGLTLPSETLKWLDWFITTMDFQGSAVEETSRMVKRFIQQRKGIKP